MTRAAALLAAASLLAAAPPAFADDAPPPVTWATPPRGDASSDVVVVRDPHGNPVDAKVSVVKDGEQRVIVITTPSEPRPDAKPGPGPWPYIMLASGATLAVTSAVFQLVAINEDSDAQSYSLHATRDDFSPAMRDDLSRSADSHHDAAKTDQAIAITCGILAVTVVSAAVTWLLVRR